MQATMIAGRRVAVSSARVQRVAPKAARRFVVRAQVEDSNSPSTSAPSPSAPSPSPLAPPPSDVEFQGPSGTLAVLGKEQEAINGRAAMLGFVAAVVSEAFTHQAIFSQIAGRYVDGELLEKPIGVSALLFGATVVLITMATLVPKMVAKEEVDGRSFGPFTPGLEKILGRAAQLGFAGLLVVELAKGSALLG